MNIKYEIIPNEKIEYCRDLCNELMVFQKSKAQIKPELFDNMNFDTRMIPSMKSATYNYIVVVKDDHVFHCTVSHGSRRRFLSKYTYDFMHKKSPTPKLTM